eukprot:9541887-Karenia_brevis.AAC.1
MNSPKPSTQDANQPQGIAKNTKPGVVTLQGLKKELQRGEGDATSGTPTLLGVSEVLATPGETVAHAPEAPIAEARGLKEEEQTPTPSPQHQQQAAHPSPSDEPEVADATGQDVSRATATVEGSR